MAGSDAEALKQLPLNEEELAILGDYLDQWNSTSDVEGPKEHEFTPAPIYLGACIDISSAQVYQKWLQNHGGKKDTKPSIKLGQKWTYQSVVESQKKKELLKKI
ncbi:hypothetical protein EDD22DRAFT_950408 [Suillus occidentalis]|nr:hypothetical protein EDD22DRAFT_950408 [Suillus occidentalis]